VWDKLESIEQRYERLGEDLARPEVIGDRERLHETARAHSELGEIVTLYRECRDVKRQIEESRELLHDADAEVRAMARDELAELEPRLEPLEDQLKRKLLPRDPNDDKDVIVEVRAGTGGDEAALFAGDLLRMYLRFAERQGWKTEILAENTSGMGGYKEAMLAVKGKGAYSKLKFEAGSHRVQRVPETESSGRIHTSTATVAVMPEAEAIELDIHPDDLIWDTFIASAAGGQHMQKNETAVRVTHKPTGTVVACQDERSQAQNREKALRMLRARIYEAMLAKEQAERAETRRVQVGSGDRSDKIRTYNYPQTRVTDHRIGLTLINRLEGVMAGEIDEIVEALRTADEADRLAHLDEAIA